MKINSHTISITPEDLETLGMAMEIYLLKELEMYHKNFEMFEEESIELLRSLTECGYTMWLDAGAGVLNGKATVDVNEWIKHHKKLLKAKKS
jgi:hypothetical protein